MSELTPKQERFCEEYIKDLNGAQAAIRAGYASGGAKEEAYRQLTNVHVQQRVQDMREELRQKVMVDAEYVISGIIGLIAKCEAAIPVKDREGNPIGEYTIQAGPAMKGYELLSRHLGLLNDKLDLNVTKNAAERILAARKRDS